MKKKVNILNKKKENTNNDFTKLLAKRVLVQKIEVFQSNIKYSTNGKIVSSKQQIVTASGKVEGIITYVIPQNVSYVKAETLLVEFDISNLIIEKTRLENEKRILTTNVKNLKKLKKGGHASKKELLDAESKLNETEARLNITLNTIKQSKIFSNFDGAIKREPNVFVGQHSRNLRELMTVINTESLQVESFVPFDKCKDIDIGSEVRIKVNYDNDNIFIKGKVVNKENHGDTISGSVRLLIDLELKEKNVDFDTYLTNLVLCGQPVEVSIDTKNITSCCIVPEESVFLDRGEKYVYIAQNNRVIPIKVNVLQAEKNKLIVEGLGDNLLLIIDGSKVVNNGDLVIYNDFPLN